MLRRLAREGGVEDRVEFLGNLPQAELVPLYRSAWALVAPSRVLANGWRDGIPNVVVEALAMGLPCIGTHTAGLGEAVRERVNGRLLAADDVGGLADALAEVVDDPAVLDAWSDAARASVLDAFDAERNFERVAALCERAWRDEADATR
jgi:glycosyltransferase involved in cell wall biosynthesis